MRPRGCRFAAGGDKLLIKLGASSLLSAEVGAPYTNEARFFPLIRRLMGAVATSDGGSLASLAITPSAAE